MKRDTTAKKVSVTSARLEDTEIRKWRPTQIVLGLVKKGIIVRSRVPALPKTLAEVPMYFVQDKVLPHLMSVKAIIRMTNRQRSICVHLDFTVLATELNVSARAEDTEHHQD